jgi:hypothetical protein
MKRNHSAGKNMNKLTLDKQTIRELKPVDLEESPGAALNAARRPGEGMEPC